MRLDRAEMVIEWSRPEDAALLELLDAEISNNNIWRLLVHRSSCAGLRHLAMTGCKAPYFSRCGTSYVAAPSVRSQGAN
jgi:hypothetical protein